MVQSTATGCWSERLRTRMEETGSLLCVGLDPDLARFPTALTGASDTEDAIVRFNAGIVEATADLVCAYKPNLGFYLAHGLPGLRALERTRRLLPPATPAILDAKVADIDSTAAAYARGVFDVFGFDAVTVNPYLGEDALAPFLDRPDRGVLVLCKTSNPGSGDVQDLPTIAAGGREPLYLAVARRVAAWDERHPASVGLVVGATYPAQLAAVRQVCPEQPILLPGIGAQAGDLEGAVGGGLDRRGAGLIVSASRAIGYAGSGADWQERARSAALALNEQIAAARGQAAA